MLGISPVVLKCNTVDGLEIRLTLGWCENHVNNRIFTISTG